MKELMLGNEALACGARDAGIAVVSAYPGTPSTEITETIAKFDDVYAEWAANEKVAAEVAMGACVAGARATVSYTHLPWKRPAASVPTAHTGPQGWKKRVAHRPQAPIVCRQTAGENAFVWGRLCTVAHRAIAAGTRAHSIRNTPR